MDRRKCLCSRHCLNMCILCYLQHGHYERLTDCDVFYEIHEAVIAVHHSLYLMWQ
jgi:hypothetical protein